jgi:hypothetical protein
MITNRLLNAENNLTNMVLDTKYLYESEEFYSTGHSHACRKRKQNAAVLRMTLAKQGSRVTLGVSR